MKLDDGVGGNGGVGTKFGEDESDVETGRSEATLPGLSGSWSSTGKPAEGKPAKGTAKGTVKGKAPKK